ncbi:MAG: DNA-protecting protein DprA [Phycisphaerae bacterium]|nr:DNA-protecting protein DprA [Phycisphaerae bacterium]
MQGTSSALSFLRLTLIEGVGPVLGRRLIDAFGSPDHVFTASPADLERIDRIGPAKARRIHASLLNSAEALEKEVQLAERLGVRIIALNDPDYPPLLAQAPDAPLVLYVRGSTPCPAETYPVAIVGSRHCTAYGVEQAERFSAALAQQGLVIVSGGARGVDSAAHRAAIRVQGKTVVIMGCGLANCYPPENNELFADITARGGSVISELPLATTPSTDTFPARNRIIAAMSLGVIVIEAPKGSGALITARVAIDDYNREVMAVPGRIDSRASEGSNELIRSGSAAMVTTPADAIEILESAARHHHDGTHADRYRPPLPPGAVAEPAPRETNPPPKALAELTATDTQRAILAALREPASINEICRTTGLEPAIVQAETTVLEIRRVILREGSKFRTRNS